MLVMSVLKILYVSPKRISIQDWAKVAPIESISSIEDKKNEVYIKRVNLSDGTFEDVLDEEINKLTEKNNSNLKHRN